MMFVLVPERTVALIIGSWSIHWYGVLYVIGFLLALFLLPRLQHWRGLKLVKDQWIEIMAWAAGGVIIGGRLGYVIFYEPLYFWHHPLEIFELWHGGMSAHGGFIGVALALYIVSRLFKVDFWKILDVAIVPAAFGLALGRFGNFINLELYGTVTTLPWGIHIPGVSGLRHPVQIYAAIKDIFIAVVCYIVLKAKSVCTGQVTALFLILYGILRFITEYWREPEWPLINIGGILFSRGQLLSLPIIVVGAMLWIWKQKKTTQK
jgi:phosphatidylglycerol:prolipoprotein diacylglycerol transferase